MFSMSKKELFTRISTSVELTNDHNNGNNQLCSLLPVVWLCAMKFIYLP